MTKSIRQLLSDLESQGVRFFLEDGEVQYRGDGAALSGEDFAEARRRKGELRPHLEMDAFRPRPLPLVPGAAKGRVPLSLTQTAAAKNNSANPALTRRPIRLHIEGPLDHEELEFAVNQVLGSCDTFACRYHVGPKGNTQQLAGFQPIALRWRDISHRSGKEQEIEVASLLADLEAAPLCLSEGKIVSGAVIRLSPNSHVFHLCTHAIAADVTSAGILAHIIPAAYRARMAGRAMDIPKPALRYIDFAIWEHDFLNDGSTKAWLKHSSLRFERLPPIDLELPFSTSEGGFTSSLFSFDPELSLALDAFTRNYSIATRAVVMTAINLVLLSLMRCDAVASGLAIGGRLPGTQLAIGPYGRIRPVVTDISHCATFVQAARLTQRSFMEAIDLFRPAGHLIVDKLALHRVITSFQPSVTVQNPPGIGYEECAVFKPLAIKVPPRETGRHLTISITEAREGLRGSVTATAKLGPKGAAEFAAKMQEVLLRGLTESGGRILKVAKS
jgi:hypothetical protein